MNPEGLFKFNWEKAKHRLHLPSEVLEKMVRSYFLDQKMISHVLIDGGCANLNYRLFPEGETNSYILRVYLRDRDAVHREQKLSDLERAKIPVPKTLYIGKIFEPQDWLRVTKLLNLLSLLDLLKRSDPKNQPKRCKDIVQLVENILDEILVIV